MMQVGFSKKYSKRRRTYPATSEAGPAEHDKAEFIIGTNKTSHGFLEFAESEVDMGLAPQFKEFALEECKGSTGLVLIAIEGHALWIEEMLRDTFTTMPALFHNQALAGSGGSSSTVPSIAENELAFALDHVYASETDEAENRYLNLSSSHIARFVRMFSWIGLKNAIPELPDRPVVVILVEAGHKLLDKIEEMYLVEDNRRWHRLRAEPCWIFADAFYLATSWYRVLEALTENLTTVEVLVYKKALPVIALARVLHMDIATTIELREYLQAHKETVERIHNHVKERYASNTPAKHHRDALILPRLTETCQVLEHQERVIATVREQLDNLLSLLFNIETVEQGKTVTRLSALAFIFIPLSFVAVSSLCSLAQNIMTNFLPTTLFGMTELHVSPHWYAAAGPPVLISTLIGGFALVKLLDKWEQYATQSVWFRQRSRGVPSSIETKKHEREIEKLSKRTPALESMKFTPSSKMRVMRGLQDEKPDVDVQVGGVPSTTVPPPAPPKPSPYGPGSAKEDLKVPKRPSRRPHPRSASLGQFDISREYSLGGRKVPSFHVSRSAGAARVRTTVRTASAIEQRLRMIDEQGVTVRDGPSRFVPRRDSIVY